MKSYTDIEQSHKLAEILPLESADMYYFLDPTPAGNIYHLVIQRIDIGIKNLPQYDEGDIPCWSLAALLGVLPKYELYNFGDTIQLDVNREALATEGDETLLDLVVNMIIHLYEIKML